MSLEIRRERVDTVEERKILISLITNTEFLKQMIPILKPELFKIPFSRRVFRWVEDYYKKYQIAPEIQIQDIYNVEKRKIHPDEASLIEIFLDELSVAFEAGFNREYHADIALKYLRKRALEAHSERIVSLVKLDRIEEAEHEQTNYRKIAQVTSPWVNPNDPEYVRLAMSDEREHLIRFPGALGEMLGWFDRGWLIATQAAYNRGKTWMLGELRTLGLLQGLRVAEINLEMSDKRMAKRYYKRITAMSEKKEGNFLYPVFDCHRNQIGNCNRPQRTYDGRLYSAERKKPLFPDNSTSSYQPCTACRDDWKLREHYDPETWFITINKPLLTPELAEKKVRAFQRHFGNNYRLKCYPRFSANISDIKRDLDLLEYVENFIPDIIVVDYADILRPESEFSDNEENRLNETWMTLAGMAQMRHCLVATATQIKTQALQKKSGKMGDASGSARAKYAHTDVVFALSQTPTEKMRKLARINIIKHRDDDFVETRHVQILQQLELGLAVIGSEFVSSGEENE